MSEMRALNGNSAVALATKQIDPDVIMAYPVTPTTEIIEHLADYAANGDINSELVNTESSLSAISGCIGASSAGGRVFTATASQGLASMHELLITASSLRLPIVIAIANRALAAPANIHADHSDAMTERDSGWIQLYSENPQEAYDNLIQAFKLAEHPDVNTPVMVNMDGYVTSHSVENVVTEDKLEIQQYVGKYKPNFSLLNNDEPVTVGSMALSDSYFEHKINQLQGIQQSPPVLKQIAKEFGDLFGRYYGLFEAYKLEDAETAVLLIGSTAGTAKETVDTLREKGEKVGLIKLRLFRPFPYREIKEAVGHLKAIAVMDRSISPGSHGGPLFNEVRSALYDAAKRPVIVPFTYGIGGRNTGKNDIEHIFNHIKEFSQSIEAGTAGTGSSGDNKPETPANISDTPAGDNIYNYVNLRQSPEEPEVGEVE
jgi:pyruvate ferredoxin oxidoreductase alpha subunit